VISVVLGDYHYGAVTSSGKLLTWGDYSHGAFGLGDPIKIAAGEPGGYATEQQRLAALSGRRPTPPPVHIPTQVRFDHDTRTRKDRFCFAAAAAGWHMGALVIDLDVRPPPRHSHFHGFLFETCAFFLQPDSGDDESDDEDPVASPSQDPSRRMPGQFPLHPVPLPGGLPTHGPGDVPILPTGRGRYMFRIGFAGRGMNRGALGPRGRGGG
jgi:SCF-associated factor 1